MFVAHLSPPSLIGFHQTLSQAPRNDQTSMTSVVRSWEGRGSAPAPIFNIRSTPIPSKIDTLIQKNALESGLERPKGYNVSFHYNSNAEFHHFGRAHPMKPWRLQLTKQLVLSFGLQYTMDLYDTQPATYDELAEFHEEDYLNYLSRYVRIHLSMHIIEQELTTHRCLVLLHRIIDSPQV